MWAITNLWWLYPFLLYRDGANNTTINSNSNFQSLIEVSKYYPSTEVLTLKQKYMFGPNSPIYEYYNRDYIQPLVLGILVFTILGLFSSKKKWFFIFLFVLGWFVSKGSNGPLGYEFFSFLLKQVSIFQIFRNPYEKFGVVFVLGYAVLFALGLSRIKNWIVRYGLLFAFCGILTKPMWDGTIYMYTKNIHVPVDYKLADKFISDNSNFDSRILHLPVLNGSVARYTWGYVGEEPAEYLFSNTSISKHYYNPILDQIYEKAAKTLDPNLLNQLNISHLVVHKDRINDKNSGGLTLVNQSDSLPSIDKKEFKVELQLPNLDVYSRIGYMPKTRVSFLDFDGEYEVIRTSNHKYKIKVINSKSPYVLILANTYDKHWKSTEGKHVKIYDFANGWEIDRLGSYDIDIIFKIWPWE
jgi:hypothetical protein